MTQRPPILCIPDHKDPLRWFLVVGLKVLAGVKAALNRETTKSERYCFGQVLHVGQETCLKLDLTFS